MCFGPASLFLGAIVLIMLAKAELGVAIESDSKVVIVLDV